MVFQFFIPHLSFTDSLNQLACLTKVKQAKQMHKLKSLLELTGYVICWTSELNCKAQNAQQLQRDNITLNNETNCLLFHKGWIWENKDILQISC